MLVKKLMKIILHKIINLRNTRLNFNLAMQYLHFEKKKKNLFLGVAFPPFFFSSSPLSAGTLSRSG